MEGSMWVNGRMVFDMDLELFCLKMAQVGKESFVMENLKEVGYSQTLKANDFFRL